MTAAEDAAHATATLAADGPATPCADDRRCVPAEWTAFLESLQGRPRHEQMAAVDRWVNARPYVEDIANWGVADYWETPGEFLAHGGDCEDYAITKYFSLTRLGFAADDLRLTIVNDSVMGAFHAVLAVRLDGETWLLDNQGRTGHAPGRRGALYAGLFAEPAGLLDSRPAEDRPGRRHSRLRGLAGPLEAPASRDLKPGRHPNATVRAQPGGSPRRRRPLA
ncbi:MAG: transglutaminase-like cysteine peptidase [Caulobacteraceae bacterium]